METLSWVLLAIAAILFIWPGILQNRAPIPETSEKVVKISDAAELDAVLSTTKCVAVDFYADWCPPCRAIAPIFSKLAEEHSSTGQLAFVKVNVDHVKTASQRYNVSAMPTFVFFRDGLPQGVSVEGLKARSSVKLTDNGLVDRILGADRVALEATVKALSLQRQA
ncbi:thioredoxin I [Cordyceps militaris]|uniref:Thioredoxin I n=1 Tax=Cordyceps militaris TaxID=73501 RepID=A0A2H4SLY4_CORMI|nr:thioredoxin I [Cordyceps militaris]